MKRGRTAAAGASAVTLLCASACANIWGFDDLRESTLGAGGEAGVIAAASGGGGKTQAASAGAPQNAAGATAGGGRDATAGGGQDANGNVAGQGGGAGISAASGGATDVTSGGMVGVAGTSGSGASAGSGDRARSGGSSGSGGSSNGLGGVAGRSGSEGVSGTGGSAGAPGCGPSNCANGCCAGDRCITVTTAQQCGRGGGACAVCGGCQLCSPNGACTIDPASRWTVRCASAQLTVAPPTGATWDPAGVSGDGTAPDPFCQFELPSGILDANTGAATRTVNDSFTATWNQTVTAGTSTIAASDLMSTSANTWRVWVGDTEFNGRATLACEVHPPLQASALIDGQLTVLNAQNCVSLTLTLVCRP